jgi:hypothetical protein
MIALPVRKYVLSNFRKAVRGGAGRGAARPGAAMRGKAIQGTRAAFGPPLSFEELVP